MEIQKSIKRITILDGFSFPSDDEDDFFLNDNEPDKDSSASSKTASNTVTGQMHNNKTPFLDKYSTDLTKAAKDGKLDPVVGREHEIQRVLEIIGRRKKNNPILIGEPGVGKSAIVEGLAQLIVKQQTSPALFNKRIVSVDLTAMVAGSKYRGQFEERIKGLITELENNPDIIIFIDEIHTLIGAGGGSGTMDAANILKPALARGTVQCIGATTFKEYANSIEKDGALERRFQKVIVEPTTTEQTLAILRNIKDRYEEHHGVTFCDEALEACVKLTERYVTDRFFPDKAIDVMDEVGSKLRLANIKVPDYILDLQNEIEEVAAKKLEAVGNQNFELAASYRDKGLSLEKKLDLMHKKWQSGDCTERIPVTESDVADVVSKMSGVPVQRMAEEEGVRLKNMSVVLKKSVIAQDDAIEKMVKAIQRNRIGLRDPNHPIGAFMFLGPTGVGKTYLAKKLAEELFGSKDALIRVDMSEYSESFNTSRLLGAPPGYVGHDEGGQLTEKVRRKPYSVVLFDEIEKAHPDVWNILLQILEDGIVTDSQGRRVDFKNTIIVMTSNVGAKNITAADTPLGFDGSGEAAKRTEEERFARIKDAVMAELRQTFRPEFLNRIDEIIVFRQLTEENIRSIARRMLDIIGGRIAQQGITLQADDDAVAALAKDGFDARYGARPLRRTLQTEVEDAVAEQMLEGKLQSGDTAHVCLKDGKVVIEK